MKISRTLILATLAVAAFATASTDASQARPLVRKQQPSRAVHAHSAKLEVSDPNGNDNNEDPLGEPFGTTFGMDDDEERKPPVQSDEGSGSQDDNEDDSDSGSGGDNEDNSTDGSGDDNEDGSGEGSGGDNEDGSGEGSGDGSGVAMTMGPAPKLPLNHPHALQTRHNDDNVGLFDALTSDAGDEDSSSGSSGNDGELSSNSGSNDGSNGSNEEDDGKTTTEPPLSVQGFDGDGEEPHHEALDLVARVSADGTSFGLQDSKTLLLGGSAIGAAVGVLAVVLGVFHLRRLQQRDEQSVLAAELPDPQTGRADGDVDSAPHGDDDAASSSLDLEEALTHEGGEMGAESEGAFVV
jgi:hypothetical protein